MHNLQSKLEKMQAKIDSEAEALGDQYLRENIKPFCDKHGLEFLSGMGMNVFYLNDKPIYSYDCPAKLRTKLKRFETELGIIIAGRDFGQYLGDYTPKDKE